MRVSVDTAVQLLEAGELVGLPTETVYGLGADARNPIAVRRVFAQKDRPVDHPVIVHLAEAGWLDRWVRMDSAQAARVQRLADALWPGPLTLILPRAEGVCDEVTGGLQTVGVRIPNHPLTLDVISRLGDGVAAPSANRFGRISPTAAGHVLTEFGDEFPVVDGGDCQIGVESTIVDLSGEVPALLRPGGIGIEQLEALVGPLKRGGTTRAPGTLASHYAPRTALLVTDDVQAEATRLRTRGLRVAILESGPVDEYARRLYAELRRLDGTPADVLVAQRAVPDGLGLAINDRLARAAHAHKPIL